MLKKRTVFFLLAALLGGCTPVTPIVTPEQSTITSFTDSILDSRCGTPCWIGIQAGVTNFEEAKNILSLRYGTNNVSNINKNDISWKAPSIDGLREGIILSTLDNTAGEIWLYPDKQANLSVERLLEILDEPTWVQVFGDPLDYCRGIGLIYSKAGVVVSLYDYENSIGVQPAQGIFLIRIGGPRLTENWNAYDSILVKWDGYKDYCQE